MAIKPKAKPRMSAKEKADLKNALATQALKENEKKKGKAVKKTPPKKTPAKKIVKKEVKKKEVKEVKEKKLSKCKFIDNLILEGGHTANEIAEAAVKEYPASLLEPMSLRPI